MKLSKIKVLPNDETTKPLKIVMLNCRHLAGNWTYNKQVTEHLTKNKNPGRAEEEDKTPLEDIILTFANDPEVLKDVPTDHCRFLKANKLEVFMAGLFQIAHVEYGITQHVFVLISTQGVPGIIYWSMGSPSMSSSSSPLRGC